MVFLHNVCLLMVGAGLISAIFLIARQFEKRSPIETKHPTADVIVDWKVAGLHFVTKQLLLPVTNACAMMLVNVAGGGWIICERMGGGFCFLL